MSSEIRVFRAPAGERMPDGTDYTPVLPREGLPVPPFSSGLVTVPPCATTWRHNHHDTEVFVLLAGRARLEWAQGRVEVGPGDIALIPPFVHHSLINLLPDTDTVFFTAWWAQREHYEPEARRLGQGLEQRTPGDVFLVMAALPTPNGDLHLGHLAGPYIAADVTVRALRQQGHRAYVYSGVDEHQTYVKLAAAAAGLAPESFLDRMVGAIRESFAGAGMTHDVFLRPSRRPEIGGHIERIFHTLLDQGHFEHEEVALPCDPATGEPLVEAFVSGRCPHCGEQMGGMFCEACSSFVPEERVREARSTVTGEMAVYRPQRRIVLRLEKYRSVLQQAIDMMALTANLKRCLARIISRPLPNVPVTHHGSWGHETEHGRLYTYLDEPAFLLSVLDTLDIDTSVSRIRPLFFFGMDNAFLYAVLTPVMLRLVDSALPLPEVMHANEFYLLDGAKFSTSRRHVLRAVDLAPVPIDWVRLHLAVTRPELEQTSFTRSDFLGTLQLRKHEWGGWLRDLFRRVEQRCGATVPEAGRWTARHLGFYVELQAIASSAARALEPASMSLPWLVAVLDRLVAEARHLAVTEPWVDGTETFEAETRTTLALELAAARALGILAAPIMPALSAALGEALGLGAVLDRIPCSDARALLRPGLPVVWSPMDRYFEDAQA